MWVSFDYSLSFGRNLLCGASDQDVYFSWALPELLDLLRTCQDFLQSRKVPRSQKYWLICITFTQKLLSETNCTKSRQPQAASQVRFYIYFLSPRDHSWGKVFWSDVPSVTAPRIRSLLLHLWCGRYQKNNTQFNTVVFLRPATLSALRRNRCPTLSSLNL